ncbi:peptidase, CARDB domain repeat-containing, putative [Geotalea daltonii FRC-32]|uniref:Peptidase, CARDB domain repeat-containing, putative n=1 Tax=Geotalea daltonii (strain DSM 22248 / JCM 15807 / FRC-32) TaxID=316067 RepID=B9M2Y3_GEODF|nr:CARDB domain-containing protein [Geotalea daltonii]ACM21329.1 peptidase, CARDB domain repeat-containing, putative [Geotalea daltonii FRC-32]
MYRYRLSRMLGLLLPVLIILGGVGISHAQNRVQINGYNFDLKEGEPSVPAVLDTADEQEPDKGPPENGRQKKRSDRKWIVQFDGPVHEADKKQLAELGARIGDYVPDFAFIVSMDNKTTNEVKKLPFVSGVVRYKPAYKIHQNLKDESGELRVQKGKKVKLHIKLDSKENQSQVLSIVHGKKGKVLDVSGDLLRVEVNQEDIAQLAQIEEVLSVEEATDLQLLNDTSKWVIQTYTSNNTKIWDHGLHGEGQIVGIGDSGIDYDMPWFRDPAGTTIGPMHRKVVGYDPTYGDDYDSNSGHGTHVAGSVGGDRTPVDGLANANGMAPKSRFFLQDISPGETRYVYPPSDLGLMFITAYNAGARLHTNSWGGGGSSYNAAAMSVDRFMWEHKDFLALFANGNAGPGVGSVGYPASAKSVVSVGATENGTGAENIASFSSNGPTADGRIKPTITAPGVNIISADSDGIKNSNNSGTLSYSGTSMATPTVAGAAALVRQYYTEGFYPGGAANSANAFTPSAALIKATLVNSGQNMSGSNTDDVIPSSGQGWGRINISKTLSFSGDANTLEVLDNNTGLATGESWSQPYFVTGDHALKATLVWTDYPGAVGAAKALVNDLDLTITAPDGTTYTGNVFSNGESAAGGNADRLNVEEQILIKAPNKGTYTITISGYNIPNGPQPFALVLTGASGVTSKGMISLNKNRYNAAGTVEIKVADLDLNSDSTTLQEVYVNIKSDTEQAGERVRLVETTPDSSVFTGTVGLRLGAPASNNGYLEVIGGNTVTGTYEDANDGTGSPATATATALIDITPPVISSVTVDSISDIGATAAWLTDEPADSTINYGETGALGSYKSDFKLSTQHGIGLGNLKEAKTYYYELYSTDEAGNLVKSDNGGRLYSFTTANVPPELTANSSNGYDTYLPESNIYGTATDHSGIASITVNGTEATYRSSDGYYELAVPLTLGMNNFTVIATDTLGNAQTTGVSINRLQPPDLVMQTIAGPPTAGTGASAAITDTVCNIGVGNSNAFSLGLYLSSDNSIATSDTRVGSRSVASLAAGQCSSGTTTVTLNGSMGSYYVGAIADYANVQYEADETNNSLAGNLLELRGPDLVVTSVSGPTVIDTDTDSTPPATVVVKVKNIGEGRASNTFLVRPYLSTDNAITTADTSLGAQYIYGLAAGEEVTLTFTTTIPRGAGGATPYYFGAITDTGNANTEIDEANNALAGNLVTVNRTQVTPDLVVTSVAGPTVIDTDTDSTPPATVTVKVKNSGNGRAWNTFLVRPYLSADNAITTADTSLGAQYIYGLAAGEEVTLTFTTTIPRGAGGATPYYFGAITDTGNANTEIDEANNALAGNLVTVNRTQVTPDLVVTSVAGPTVIDTDTDSTPPATVTVKVKNSGNGRAWNTFLVRPYLSADNAITTADTSLGAQYIYGLAAGEEVTLTFTTTIPRGAGGATPYYFGAITDTGNANTEIDEANNALAGNLVTVNRTQMTPDLVVTSVAGPTVIDTDTDSTPPATVTVKVKNSGNGRAWNTFLVRPYLSTDNAITTADTSLGAQYIYGLAAGEEVTLTFTTTIPRGAGGATPYYFGAITDTGNANTEIDEANNALAGNLVTVNRTQVTPDLVVTSVAGPTVIDTDTDSTPPATVTVKVKNSGNGRAWNTFLVRPYLSTDNAITTADTSLGAQYIYGLAAGEEVTLTFTTTIPRGAGGATPYYFGAITDTGNANTEIDEANNALAGNLVTVNRTQVTPDLVVTSVAGPTVIDTDTDSTPPATVTVKVKNSGNGRAWNTFLVRPYLSADNAITTADTSLGAQYIYGLAAGEEVTLTFTTTIPRGAGGATPYYFGAITDTGNANTEIDEANNALAGNLVTVNRTQVTPDLVVTSVAGPLSANTGQMVPVTLKVKNAGNGRAWNTFLVRSYISADNEITTADTSLGAQYIYGLAAGEETTITINGTVPSTFVSGTYYFGGIADTGNANAELNETNNALAGNEIVITKL